MPPTVPWLPSSSGRGLLTRTLQLRNDAQADFAAVKSQWANPNDILSILTIIGGDIVKTALASLAAPTPLFGFLPLTPVAFSFGWVGYAFSAILSSIGDGKLMPAPDCSAILVNARSGYSRPINSFILSRLVRDYECPNKRGLTVAFFRTSPSRPAGMPARDWVYWSGLEMMVCQIGIACIPGALSGNWLILILTVGGTLLALLQGALPQWRQEKWSARKVAPGKQDVVCLTRGNGSVSVLVIVSDGCGYKLEDLAAAREVHSRVTAPATFVLAALWIVHLITTESLNSSAWYSLAVGGLGMLQNVIAAGARREAGALGFHLEKGPVVHEKNVFGTLKKVEEMADDKESAVDMGRGVGLSLIPIFFPGGLREDEEKWVKERTKINKMLDHKDKERATFNAAKVSSPSAAPIQEMAKSTIASDTKMSRSMTRNDSPGELKDEYFWGPDRTSPVELQYSEYEKLDKNGTSATATEVGRASSSDTSTQPCH
ncbi:uncharacterized protein LAESUDRAFT_726621 [Laetiporus sulphureus 93-53]|uniref:Uncharacterized protein n=1 Tax=Laetiporus sulphureus 93-53 TaxID=1314785 RepID=A0A165DV90_9APHY|nr:uncharacterized protein LAESUDRAFT_726621 [Laetiporus sulphureus 93-53]KZT05695.1 hypothetical protein LAESUDRAFT_726621 [Laetiporus sulphureus 93-53]